MTKHPGDSSEQQEVEEWLVAALSKKLGITLSKKIRGRVRSCNNTIEAETTFSSRAGPSALPSALSGRA